MLITTILASFALAFPERAVDSTRIIGEWHPPVGDDNRGPCPALNTLANHGIFPRNGKNITDDNISSGLMDVYKFSKTIADTLVGQIKELKNEHSLLDLNNLRKHDAIEHDSSLVHQDSYFGPNWVVQPAMLANLKAAAADGKSLTISELGKYRRVREADSLARNPEYYFPARHASNAHAEAATLIAVFGVAGEAVPLDSLQSFLGDERLPADYSPRNDQISVLEMFGLMNKIAGEK